MQDENKVMSEKMYFVTCVWLCKQGESTFSGYGYISSQGCNKKNVQSLLIESLKFFSEKSLIFPVLNRFKKKGQIKISFVECAGRCLVRDMCWFFSSAPLSSRVGTYLFTQTAGC